MKLTTIIRKLKDGRFQVKYYWSVWEHSHKEYFDNAEEVGIFLAELANNTKWK